MANPNKTLLSNGVPSFNLGECFAIEGEEIQFMAYNVTRVHENPSLLRREDEQVLAFTTSFRSESVVVEARRIPVPNNHSPNMDLRRMKRIAANRASAQRARIRKLAYIEQLKKEINILMGKVAVLRTQLTLEENHLCRLMMENEELKLKIQVLENQKSLKEVEFLQMMNLLKLNQGKAMPCMPF